jgi:tRNA (guanine37-N1)-methyltransferase
MISSYVSEGMVGRAVEKRLLDVRVTDIRDFTDDRHRSVDDAPYGGGPGMVMKVEPIARAIRHVKADGVERHLALLTPGGAVFNQGKAAKLLGKGALLLVCGRYEGVDERVVEMVDEEISIGDYILTGGELAALVIMDAVSRLVPGVLGNERSAGDESFSKGPNNPMGLVEYPQYTRPAVFGAMAVPGVLLSGDHAAIARWRKKSALKKTLLNRPYLLAGLTTAGLTIEESELLEEIKEEMHNESVIRG